MESVIKDQLLNYLLHKKLITKHQHGFLYKRSTATNLLECTQNWIVALSNHHCALGKDMGRLATESATAQLQRVVGYS
jgi:hypothetical protein